MSKQKQPSSRSKRERKEQDLEDEMEILQRLQNEFDNMDKQNTGDITWKQAQNAFQNLGYYESDVNRLLFDEKSNSKRKTINFDQFISFAMNLKRPKNNENKREKAHYAFQLLDYNSSGGLTFDHLKRAATMLGEDNLSDQDLREMITEMDLDGDGEINFQEFIRILKKTDLY